MLKFFVVLLSFLFAPLLTFAATTTYSNLEQTSGWQSCTGCAGGGGHATFSMTQGLLSPTVTGALSTKFSLGGTTPFSNALFFNRVTSNTTASNFILDMYLYMTNPSASQALEFAANQGVNNRWYKFSTQCSFSKGVWRVWDSYHSNWVGTTVPCTRPTPYTWTHLHFEYQRASGMAKFVSIAINGQTFYVNKSFLPESTSTNGSIGVHFQMDGNISQTAYSAWVSEMNLTVF
jgi:hypothetical protein